MQTMSHSRSVFRRVWQFNAIVIAFAGLMLIGYGLIAGYYIARDLFGQRNVTGIAPSTPAKSDTSRPAGAGEPTATPPRRRLAVHSFQETDGVMWARLTSKDRVEGRYYSKKASNTRDLIFYDIQSGSYRRLLERDDVLIPWHHFLQSAPAEGKRSTVALLVTVVDKDSNGDGRLSAGDLKSVALADPAGRGLTTVAKNIKSLLGQTVTGDGAAAVLMVEDAKGAIRGLTVALSDFTVNRNDAFRQGKAPAGG